MMNAKTSFKKYKSFQAKLTAEDQKRLDLVQSMALQLMKEYKVDHYKFKFSYSRQLWGRCCYTSETISIQIYHAVNSPIESIRNTILHEIAHAIVGPGIAHRVQWQEKAKELGVTWDRRYHK